MIFMLKPADMVRIEAFIPKEVKEKASRMLQEKGITEVEFQSNESLEEKGIQRSIPLADAESLSMLLIEASNLIDFYREYDTYSPGFFVDILGIEEVDARKVERPSVRNLIKDAGNYIEKVSEDVEEFTEKKSQLEKNMEELSALKADLSVFAELNPRLEWIGETDHIFCEAVQASPRAFSDLEAALTESLGDGFGIDKMTSDDGRVIGLVYAPKKDCGELEKQTRKANCTRISLTGEGRVKDALIEVDEKIVTVKAAQGNLLNDIRKSFDANNWRLTETLEFLRIEKSKCEVFIRCGMTDATVVLSLFAPKTDKEAVFNLIDEASSGVNHIEVDDNPVDAPILLDNPPVISSFEVLTNLFSPPKYGDIDPTILIAPSFAIFFGLMLTDAVYGALLTLGCLVIMRKYGRYSKGLYDLAVILAVCGVSAVFFGLLTGSILGDLVGKYILGGEGSQDIAIWKDPLYKTNSIIFLTLVCTMGLFHIFFGYFMGAYSSVRKGDYKTALTDYGSWFILAAGVVTVVLAQIGRIPANTTPVGYALALTGLVLLFASSGLMAFLKIVGVVGNTLSYARLLALALTTAGIAMTFNFLASISLKIPYIGLGVAAVVFIFGHLINILMNTLGGFVHALRLHYVEFFGTFYPGGGRQFNPFREDRKYTKAGE